MPTSRLAPVLCLCLCATFLADCARRTDGATPSPEVVTQVKVERQPIDASVLAGCPDEPAQPAAAAPAAAQYTWLYAAVEAGRACRAVARQVGTILAQEVPAASQGTTSANSAQRQ